MKRFFFTLVLVQLLVTTASSQWILHSETDKNGRSPIGISKPNFGPNSRLATSALPLNLFNLPFYLEENGRPTLKTFEKTYWPSETLPQAYQAFAKTSVRPFLQNSEMRVILEQGPKENRICLTFLGDGYTEAEREKFFDDVNYLVRDLFEGSTFTSYRPIFNIYAVFVASRDSGITDVARKNTAFGLYRSPAGSKRAIMPGNTRALENALLLAPKTDYPVVVANDDFYGGLGGRYAITTRSRQSGRVVLRHELGHNFGNVGEEYDGGSVYSGANSSRTPNTGWSDWNTKPETKPVNDMRMLGGAYVWKNLKEGSVKIDFDFPAANQNGAFWFDVAISSVGWQSLNDVEVLLNGEPLIIKGVGTSDRSFFSTELVNTLPGGRHTLEVKEVNPDGDNVLAFANLYAYEPNYAFKNTVAAFKTYDTNMRVSYRPTHDQCLMRDMLYPFFCSVDQENMWFQFFDQVRLIDAIEIESTVVNLKLQALENLFVSWYEVNPQNPANPIEIESLRGKLTAPKTAFQSGKTYQAKVRFETLEVRKNRQVLEDKMNFSL